MSKQACRIHLNRQGQKGLSALKIWVISNKHELEKAAICGGLQRTMILCSFRK